MHNKIVLPIKGMHCRSCELLIEEKLKEVDKIQKVEVNHKTGEAEIHYSGNQIDRKKLEEAVVEAGYEIGLNNKAPFFSTNPKDYKSLGWTVFFVLVLYWFLKGIGLLDLNIASASNPSSLGVVILIGLVAGFSSCMALIGGLTLGLSAKHANKHPEATPAQKFRPHLFFNAGRIGGYAFFGGILGTAGSVFQLSSTVMGLLIVLAGAVMLLIGLQLVNIFPALNAWKLTLPKGLSKMFGISNRNQREYSHKNSMILGASTFFLPCGFTQAMQLYAVSTGSFGEGALVMAAFAIGTAPGLLSVGGLSSVMKGASAKRFFRFAGVVVVLLAFFNLSNGFNLLGWDFGSGPAQAQTVKKDPNVKLVDGVQVVKMKEVANGYSPNKFTIKKGIPVRWEIDAQAPYSCASSLVVSKLNIRKSLKAGKNVIEFTPKQTGKIAFSCSMGMYTGAFNVVDGNNIGSNADEAANDSGNNAVAQGGGCGGGGSVGGGCGGCGGGGSKKALPADTTPTSAKTDPETNEQVIAATYTQGTDIIPSAFTAKAGQPVRFEIDAKDDGVGCMSTIMIPGLVNRPELLRAGEKIVFNFTPTEPGDYKITCSMGMARGTLTVK